MALEQLDITRDIIYATPGGTPLAMDLFGSAGAVDLPVIMLVHGGGWCLGVREWTHDLAGMLAGKGYLAASISYRLAPAFPYPAACEDVTAAAAWLVAHAGEYGGDARRLGGYGGSAGAHLIAWLATAPDTPLACAVPWAGPMDMFRDPVFPSMRSYPLAFMGNCPHDAPEAYTMASPLSRLTTAVAPMLLVHGIDDLVVPVDHARWMTEAAQAIGAPVSMHLLPGVGHTGGDPNDPLQTPGWQAMLDFFARHLR